MAIWAGAGRTDAFALAGAVTLLLAHRQSAWIDRAGDGPQPGWARAATYRAEVHQATGMVSVQLGVSLAEALVRLRARAYADGRPIAQVAADVVGRRLRFEDHDRSHIRVRHGAARVALKSLW